MLRRVTVFFRSMIRLLVNANVPSSPISITLKMETMRSPKRRLAVVLHGTMSQKASLLDTAVKASQKTVFVDH
jgi:hypothetical protein